MTLGTARTIIREEGKRLTVYLDTEEHPTVGIGHKVVPTDQLQRGDTITEERCDKLFQADFKRAQSDATAIAYHAALGRQSPLVYHTLTCMVFQMGYLGVFSFSKMLAAMRRHDYALAANEMLSSRWARQTPARAQRLTDGICGFAKQVERRRVVW